MKNVYRIWILTFLFTLAGAGIFLQDDTTNAAKAAKAAKPNLTVPLSKVSLEGAKLERDAGGQMIYSASVRNRSKKGTIKKIEYIYSIMAPQSSPAVEIGDAMTSMTRTTVTLTAKQIGPGKTSKPVSCIGDASGQLSAMELIQIRLYAGTALYTYDTITNKGSTCWGSKDKKPPVIRG